MSFLEIIRKNMKRETEEELKIKEKPLPLFEYISNRSGIIGEFKRGTPEGEFKIKLLPEEIASIYEKYNFSAVSVVVEERFFFTKPDDLKRIKNTVSIPVIYKGFITEESQIIRARNLGADSILLIVRILGRKKLIKLLKICDEIQIEPIVEVFSEDDLKIVSDLPVKILGINNRDLETLKVDFSRGEKILSMAIDKGVGKLRIIESGLKKPEDILKFKALGADGYLIGRAFLESPDIEKSVKEFSEAIKK